MAGDDWARAGPPRLSLTQPEPQVPHQPGLERHAEPAWGQEKPGATANLVDVWGAEGADGVETRTSAVMRLAHDLAASASGLDFLYATLATVAEERGWEDVILVLEDPSMGRQLFRRDRKPLDESELFARSLDAPAGVLTAPPDADAELLKTVHDLCAVAVRIDLLRHDAAHDALTALYNRRSFDQLLAQACSRSERYGLAFALVLLDVDGFKAINDQRGHAVGDMVLRTVGLELLRSLRTGDVAARIGGDEFALLLMGGDDQLVETIVNRIRGSVGMAMDGTPIGLSGGTAASPKEGVDPAELYLVADRRLYEAKAR